MSSKIGEGRIARTIKVAASVVRQAINRDMDISMFATLEKPLPSSEIEEIIYSGQCRRIHKWTHYPSVYERLFNRFKGTDVRFLEIGVFGGGSLDMWRSYLGPKANIHGVDINPDCAELNTPETPVHIGSQDDPDFLRDVVAQMGGLDVVLDDGSHIGKHQRKSFEILWPLLREGGLYVIEDVHTSYWSSYEGGYRKRGTAIELVKDLMDDMHGWYHHKKAGTPAQKEVGSVQIFDSIIAIEKQKRDQPAHIIVE